MMGRLTIAAAVSSLLLLAATSASAETGSPWWHLLSASQPSYVQPGTAKQQVWQLTVSATEGTYRLDMSPYSHVILEAGESSGRVRAAIEGALRERFYFPAGPILQVAAQPGRYNKNEVYEIKLVGEQAYSHNFELLTE